jgi:hypothetical protein
MVEMSSQQYFDGDELIDQTFEGKDKRRAEFMSNFVVHLRSEIGPAQKLKDSEV